MSLLHIEQGIIKEADLNSKKPYLLKDLENSNVDKKEYENIIQLCNKADPTDNKAVYTQWILKQYLNGNFQGEEDIEKFRDTLNKFTKLKNSKKIDKADLNQYKSYGELAEKVNGILEESGGYTSKREEETTKAEEGIQKIDQDGDIELFVVNTPEAAAKEFRNTEWCVKDPRWFNSDRYGGTDKNFYYFKKDGEPYLLLHKNDFRDVYDNEPSEDDLYGVLGLIMKHNLPRQDELLTNKILTKEDGELFDKAVTNMIEQGEFFYLVRKNIISTKEKDFVSKAVDVSKETGNSDIYYLLLGGDITKEDGELFDKAVVAEIEKNPDFIIEKGFVTKEDGELFNKAVNKVLEEGNYHSLIFLLYHKHIAREDGELFNMAVNKVIECDDDASNKLVELNIITEEELDNIKNNQGKTQETNEEPETEEQDINKMELLHITTIDKIAGAWGEHYSECDGYLDLLDDFLYNQLLEDCAFSDKTDYNAKIEAMGLFFDIIQNKNLYYNSAKDYLEKCINVLENILKTENFSSWRDPVLKRKSTEQFLQDMKDFLKTHKTRSTNLFDKFDEAKEPGCINVHASSEDLEISRGEIGVSIEDYDPSKDKEKSTKNRWSEKPNQNTAVIPAAYQESDNYKKDKLDKAKYTNFLGRTDQDKPVELADFALPNQPARKDETFEKYTDTIQDDQQQYDTRNFGKGNLKPTQHSNFLYKSELLHIEQGIIKEAGKKELIQEIQGKKKISEEEAKNIYNNIVSLGSNYQNDKNYYKYVRFLVNQYLNGNFNPNDPGDAAKASGGSSLFLDAYNKNLLTSEKENQLRFNDFHNTLHKLLGDESGVDMSIQERTQDTDAKLLNKIKDENENVYHLFEVPTSENVGKLFNGSSWCIRNSATAYNYLENGKAIDNQEHPFFFVTKNGEPYLLHHVLDFRQKQDMIPSVEDDNLFNSLINNTELGTEYKIANHLPLNKEEVESLNINNINNSKNHTNSYKLAYIADEYAKAGKDLPDNFFDQWDGKMAYNLVKYFLNTQGEVPNFVWDKWSSWNKDYEVGSILSTYIQSGKQEEIPEFLLDRENYYSDSITTFLQAGLEVPENIWEHWTTDENDNGVEVFKWYYNPNHKNKIQDGLLDKINEHYQGSTLDILVEDKKEPFLDSKTKDALVNQELKEGDGYYLLKNKIITREDGELFNKAVNNAIEKGHGYGLLNNEVITQEELDNIKNNQGKTQETNEEPEAEEQQEQDINKMELLHITTIDKIARGYAFDHSKSNNALNAEYQGKFPLTHATKIVAENFGITQQQAKWLLDQIGPTEWHHTSSHYNQTDYYDTNTDSIIEELQEIDNESPISTVEDVREYINSKFVKPEASQEKGYYADFDYIIWGGTRKYPTVDEQSLKNVYVVEKGSFYYVYDSEDGDLIVKKKIGSNGTRVHKLPTQEELDERRRIENERIALYNFNTSQETRDFIAQGGSYSSSGNFYPEGKKPSPSEYEAGLEKFFQVGDRIAHLTEFPQGYILQEWNGTEFVDLEDTSKMVSSYEELPEEAKIFKNESLTISAAEAKDSAGETSITPTVTDNVVDQVTQKPTDNVTQGKGGGKPVKGTKRGGTGTRPVKALYSTNLKSIDIIADQFGDWTTRTELPESSLKRFRGQDANEKNEKENKDLKKKMKGKPNKPLYNVPKKDVYAWGNDDLMGGTVFYSDMSLPQMGDLSEMN